MYRKWLEQRAVELKEWVIKNVPGKMNMEVMLLPKAMRMKLERRNRKELLKEGCRILE